MQATVPPGGANCRASIPFTQAVVAHVGMTDLGHAAAGCLLERNDPVMGPFAAFFIRALDFPVQANRKATKKHFFQLNGLGLHRHRPLFQVNRQLRELVLDGH